MFIVTNESACLYYGILLRIYHHRAYMIPDEIVGSRVIWDDIFESMHSKWELCLREESSCWLCLWLYYLPMKSDHYHLIYVLHLRGSYAMTWSMRKCILYHYISCYVHHYVSILFSSWVESIGESNDVRLNHEHQWMG